MKEASITGRKRVLSMDRKMSAPMSDTAKAIEVRLRVSDYPKDMPIEPSLWEMLCIGKLKAAGVPIDGMFMYQGLKSGTLSRLDDPEDFGACVYRWTP